MPDKSALAIKIENAVAEAKDPVAARQALALLFPKAEKVLNTYLTIRYSKTKSSMRGRRISMSDFAHAYFRLDPQPATWGRSEIEAVLDSTDPLSALQAIEEKIERAPLQARNRLRRIFLESLEDAFGEDRAFTLEWLNALVELAPRYIATKDEDDGGLFFIDSSFRIRSVITQALMALSTEERSPIVEAAIRQAKDISVLCDVVRGMAGDRHAEGVEESESRGGFGSRTDIVRQELYDRVKELAADGQIWSQAAPEEILWFWWGLDQEAEVRSFLNRSFDDKRALFSLFDITVGQVRSSSGNFERVGQDWRKILDLEELGKRAQIIEEQSADEGERALAKRYLSALAKQIESY